MRAAVVPSLGAPLEIRDIPVPTPVPVRSWSGSKLRESATPTSTPPAVTGR